MSVVERHRARGVRRLCTGWAAVKNCVRHDDIHFEVLLCDTYEYVVLIPIGTHIHICTCIRSIWLCFVFKCIQHKSIGTNRSVVYHFTIDCPALFIFIYNLEFVELF